MTADERLASIRLKIERARKHVSELNIAVKAFLDTCPYVVGTKRDPQSRKLVYYLVSVKPVPLSVATIVGDIMQNLRSALDHLAYQLVLVGSNDNPSARIRIYFPIFDSASEYQTKKLSKLQGARLEAIEAIDAVKPYKGGNDLLWYLHKLNNVDKHRLVLAVGSAYRSVNIGAHMHKMMSALWADNGVTLPAIDVYVKPADRLFPLKAGDELFIDGPDAEVNGKMDFCFDVAFGEPQIIDGAPLIETLSQMTNLVDNIILGFRQLLV